MTTGDLVHVQLALESVSNAMRRLWQIIADTLAFFSIFYGVGYALQGNTYATSPALYVLRKIPGHMSTHGWLMIALGVALIVETAQTDHIRRHIVMRIFCGYCVLVSVTIFGSWWITDQVAFSAPWAWVAFAVTSGALVKYPPPPRVSRGGIRA